MNNKMSSKKSLFPKVLPELTNEQELIKSDFLEHWSKKSLFINSCSLVNKK